MDKAKALLKLWNCFPSTAGMSDEQARGFLMEWRETVDQYSDAVVDAACVALRKRDVAFLPSAGQIRAECEKAAADAAQRIRTAPLGLAGPQYSEAHREEMKRQFNSLSDEVRSGANFNPEYGLVPRGTKPSSKVVNRFTPRSWLNEWEVQNKRPYPARVIVEAKLREQYAEAAE